MAGSAGHTVLSAGRQMACAASAYQPFCLHLAEAQFLCSGQGMAQVGMPAMLCDACCWATVCMVAERQEHIGCLFCQRKLPCAYQA